MLLAVRLSIISCSHAADLSILSNLQFSRNSTFARRSSSYLSSSLNLKYSNIKITASFESLYCWPRHFCDIISISYRLYTIGNIGADTLFDRRDVYTILNKLQMVRIKKKFLYSGLVGIVSSSLIFLLACFSRYFADEILLRSPRRVR